MQLKIDQYIYKLWILKNRKKTPELPCFDRTIRTYEAV